MKFRFFFQTLVLLYSLSYFSLSYADKSACEAINCDCSSIEEGKWHDLCVAGEQMLTKDCGTSHRKIKGYCGFHGPSATPVAIEIKLDRPPPAITDRKLKPLVERIAIQDWSLKDDLSAVSDLAKRGSLDDALTFFGIYRSSANALFEEKLQVALRSREVDGRFTSKRIAQEFASSALELSNELLSYSTSLWEEYSSTKNKRSHLSLTLGMAQEAALAFERTGAFYALSEDYRDSASVWEKAADQSNRLVEWEKLTRNRVSNIAKYNSQTKARINRAILYRVKADEPELAEALHKKVELSSVEVLALRNANVKAEKEQKNAQGEREKLLDRLQFYGSSDSVADEKEEVKEAGKSSNAKDKLKALRGI